MSHVYCPECGFQNPEAANFCARCGALLVHEQAVGETTMALTTEEAEEEGGVALEEELGVEGPSLVVRAGGGRTGEVFPLKRRQTTIGRSPDCDIFLDDVTVSRRHAIVSQQSGGFAIEDLGSLNGTFLNRHRIETSELQNGDELQVGKYRMIFFSR